MSQCTWRLIETRTTGTSPSGNFIQLGSIGQFTVFLETGGEKRRVFRVYADLTKKVLKKEKEEERLKRKEEESRRAEKKEGREKKKRRTEREEEGGYEKRASST